MFTCGLPCAQTFPCPWVALWSGRGVKPHPTDMGRVGFTPHHTSQRAPSIACVRGKSKRTPPRLTPRRWPASPPTPPGQQRLEQPRHRPSPARAAAMRSPIGGCDRKLLLENPRAPPFLRASRSKSVARRRRQGPPATADRGHKHRRRLPHAGVIGGDELVGQQEHQRAPGEIPEQDLPHPQRAGRAPAIRVGSRAAWPISWRKTAATSRADPGPSWISPCERTPT